MEECGLLMKRKKKKFDFTFEKTFEFFYLDMILTGEKNTF